MVERRKGGSRIKGPHQSGTLMGTQSGMTKRREPAWVPYFLKSLERLGEVRGAAAEAGIDFTSAYARRKAHPDFAQAWDGALERWRVARDESGEARVAAEVVAIRAAVPGSVVDASLDTLETNGPGVAASLDMLGTNGLVTQSTGPHSDPLPQAGEGARRRRLALGGNGRWSEAREALFFEELAASASVRRGAKAAGVSAQAVYARRAKSPHFRTKWDAVLEVGRARLDALLVEAANRTFDPDEEALPDCAETPKVSVTEAIRIVQMHGSARQKQELTAVEPSKEEMDVIRSRLLDKLQRLADREEREREEQGWVQDPDHDGHWVPPGWVRAAHAG